MERKNVAKEEKKTFLLAATKKIRKEEGKNCKHIETTSNNDKSFIVFRYVHDFKGRLDSSSCYSIQFLYNISIDDQILLHAPMLSMIVVLEEKVVHNQVDMFFSSYESLHYVFVAC